MFKDVCEGNLFPGKTKRLPLSDQKFERSDLHESSRRQCLRNQLSEARALYALECRDEYSFLIDAQ